MALTNRLGLIAAERGLSEQDVAGLVGEVLGRRLDRRTLRRYLDGTAIDDPTLEVVAAIARALGVTIDEAVSLDQAESVSAILKRAGIRFHEPRRAGPMPPGFWAAEPGWGDLVTGFLEDRHREV
ncbi:MAG: helix-turn-helix domain-containing protein [Candidatus Dormibacteria bacterium]